MPPVLTHKAECNFLNSAAAVNRIIAYVAAALVLLLTACNVTAQDVRNDAVADSLFDLGVEAYRGGRYTESRAFFKLVVADEPIHRNTTAAALMASKASFQLGNYRDVVTETAHFVEQYESSGYIEEARLLRSMAASAMIRNDSEVTSIGIILSLDQTEVSQTQALFNGIQTAVYDFNRNSNDRLIRMIFRDTQSRPSKTAAAVKELADENVAFIIGALFSNQAIAAAEAADENEIVFIAPLATDERVTDNRKYAFQANPSIRMRGRLMARFAVNGLRLHRLGVLAIEDPERISERLTDAFIEEASRLGAEINLVSIMSNTNQWARLSESMPAGTLDYIDAVYAPVTFDPPEPIVGSLFSNLDRMRPKTLRVLGNSSYHDLPMASDASRYLTTYSNDFYEDESSERVLAFRDQYERDFGDAPNRLVYSGYDVTAFMLHTLQYVGSDKLVDVLYSAPVYDGIVSRIGFEGGNVNRAMFYHRYINGQLGLLR